MRRPTIQGSLVILAGLLFTACAGSPPMGAPVPPPSRVLPADARALRYGASAPEVFNNPELGDRVRALFGADWSPGGQIAFGAPTYFPASASLRMVRLGDGDYIAITGCVPSSCATHRGLVLIRQDGEQLMARLDEGGFSHYYERGPGARANAVPRSSIDSAWRAVEGIDRG
jgi:hypothetical protein